MTDRTRSTTLADAKLIRAATFGPLAAHIKVCGTCQPADLGVLRYCAEGWELAKAYAAARSEVARHQALIADRQPGLF